MTNAHVPSGNQQFLRTRLDPLINPGKISSHVHAIAGTSNFLAEQSFNQSRAGEVGLSGDTAKGSARPVISRMICRATGLLSYTSESGFGRNRLFRSKWKNGTFTAIQGDGLISYW